jgi:hypothetical protein
MSQMDQEAFQKALDHLGSLAKGHNSRGTNTTQVESMQDGGVSSSGSQGATQVNHEKNSERKDWAGSNWSAVADNGPGADSVKEDGTDYQAQAKVMKSIMTKLAKGIQLSEAEMFILKSVVGGDVSKSKDEEDDVEKGKMPPFMKEDDDMEDKAKKAKDYEDDEDEDMGKSLSQFAAEDGTVSKGLEVSEFLESFVHVMQKSLEAAEHRIVARLSGQVNNTAEVQGEFQKSLASAVAGLGEAMAAVAQRVDQVEQQPAHGFKSHQNVHVLEKGGFNGPSNEPISKALVASTLVDLAEAGQVQALDVINFESNGVLSPELEMKVRGAISGR